jgi:hypothetical protein
MLRGADAEPAKAGAEMAVRAMRKRTVRFIVIS